MFIILYLSHFYFSHATSISDSTRCMPCGKKVVCGAVLNERIRSQRNGRNISVRAVCRSETIKHLSDPSVQELYNINQGRPISFRDLRRRASENEYVASAMLVKNFEEASEDLGISDRTSYDSTLQNTLELNIDEANQEQSRQVASQTPNTKRNTNTTPVVKADAWVSPLNEGYVVSGNDKGSNTNTSFTPPSASTSVSRSNRIDPTFYRQRCEDNEGNVLYSYNDCYDLWTREATPQAPKAIPQATRREAELPSITPTTTGSLRQEYPLISNPREVERASVLNEASPIDGNIGSSRQPSSEASTTLTPVGSITPAGTTSVSRPSTKARPPRIIEEYDPDFVGPPVPPELRRKLKRNISISTPFGGLEIVPNTPNATSPEQNTEILCHSIEEWDKHSYALTLGSIPKEVKSAYTQDRFCSSRKEYCEESSPDFLSTFSVESLTYDFCEETSRDVTIPQRSEEKCQIQAERSLIDSCLNIYGDLSSYLHSTKKSKIIEGIGICKARLSDLVNDPKMRPVFSHSLVKSVGSTFSCPEGDSAQAQQCAADNFSRLGIKDNQDCIEMYEYLSLSGERDRRSRLKPEWRNEYWFQFSEYFYDNYAGLVETIDLELPAVNREACFESLATNMEASMERMEREHRSNLAKLNRRSGFLWADSGMYKAFQRQCASAECNVLSSTSNQFLEGEIEATDEVMDQLDEDFFKIMNTHRRLTKYLEIESGFCRDYGAEVPVMMPSSGDGSH